MITNIIKKEEWLKDFLQYLNVTIPKNNNLVQRAHYRICNHHQLYIKNPT